MIKIKVEGIDQFIFIRINLFEFESIPVGSYIIDHTEDVSAVMLKNNKDNVIHFADFKEIETAMDYIILKIKKDLFI